MHFHVSFTLVGSSEATIAYVAGEGLLACVRAHVCRQMVGAREGTRTHMTLERLVALFKHQPK